MMQTATDTSAEVMHALLGKRCWYASCGGGAGPTFQLALGEKIPRQDQIKNNAHSDEYRQFEGESNLLVWCTWRLDDPERPITSSDDSDARIREGLARLVGAVVREAHLDMPGWDLQLSFSNDVTLRVFCDHVLGEPSFDGNWELWQRERIISIGAGSACEVEPRE